MSSIYDAALSLLAFRARSTAELRRKLLRKGAEAVEVEQVISRLVDQKVLDDFDFARQFARTKLLDSGASRLWIRQELSRKGVARDIADQAIDALQEGEGIDPAAAIHRVATKKWKSLAKLDDFTRRRRLYAFLARRGFTPDEIRSVLSTLGEAIET